MHAGDHRGERQVEFDGELVQGGGLSDAWLSPQEDREIGGDSQGEGLDLEILPGLGGGLGEQRQQVAGDGELGGG